jgi:2,3-bisphosphoglycerate-dependent phosphoglycerate mutase
VTDLQCPARVFLARHGEAEYETELFMDHGGSLTARGRAQARQLGERLHTERMARVYSSTVSRAVQTAELAAGVLGVDVSVREGLMELALGDHRGQPAGTGVFDPVVRAWTEGDVEARAPGSESAVEIAARVGTVLDSIADQHRGESVLVVTHGGAIVATLVVLAQARDLAPDVANGAAVLIERDADGWRLG